MALNKRVELTELYRQDMEVFRPEELVFVDETFCVSTDIFEFLTVFDTSKSGMRKMQECVLS